MSVIYEPSGMAREYAELACNLYKGCTHGCHYCYAPAATRTHVEDFHARCIERPNVLAQLAKDAKALRGDRRRVLFCFTCDAYQPGATITREALQIMRDAGVGFDVLTKGGLRATPDFDLYADGAGRFGASISFTPENDGDRELWEPNAASINSRLAALAMAHEQGIYTWVSIEPVINPSHALWLIANYGEHVDEWRLGKLNHRQTSFKVDWRGFAHDVYEELQASGKYYVIKDGLAAFLPGKEVRRQPADGPRALMSRAPVLASLF